MSKRKEKTPEKAENVLWTGKPSLWAFYGFYVVGILVIVSTAGVASLFQLPLWVLGIMPLFVAGMFLLPLRFQKAWTFTLTDRSISSEFCFWVRRQRTAPLQQVTNVTVDQGFVGRLLGFGDVRADTAGTPFMGVRFWGVRDPLRVGKRIKETRVVTRLLVETVGDERKKKRRGL